MTVASQQPVETAVERLRAALKGPHDRSINLSSGVETVWAKVDVEDLRALLARAEEAERERDEAEANAMNWFGTHLSHRTALDALGKANGELFKRAYEAEQRLRASSPVSDPVSQIGTTLDRWSRELKGYALGEELAHLAAKVSRGDYLTPAAGTET
jgi:hypothetical protein